MTCYENRFASIERLANGTWIVFREVPGLPVYEDPEADEPTIKEFPTYEAARTAMIEVTEYYKGIPH